MAKVLNLDELETDVEKSIVVDGKTHKMKAFTVEEFISDLKEAEALDEKRKADGIESFTASENFNAVLDIVKKRFPTITSKSLNSISPAKVFKILEFIRASADELEARSADEASTSAGN